jgi:predicted HTH transcriptional regulator
MVSMANRANGVILFGVSDDGEIVGIESDKHELVETTRAP